MPAFLASELPVRARTRQHWVTLLRLPPRWLGVVLLALLLGAWIRPDPVAVLLVVVLLGLGFLRVQTWWAEQVILTGKRIIRVQGVPETTSTEASLRIDRISGARLVQTLPGKLLGYGTIELEAPGDHPGVRKLIDIAHAGVFYLHLRDLVFGEAAPDPDDEPIGPTAPHEHVTEPLPALPPAQPSGGS